MIVRGRGFNDFRAIASSFNRANDRGDVLRRPGRPADRGLPGIQIHARALAAGHALNGLGHMACAIGAVHAADGQFPGERSG